RLHRSGELRGRRERQCRLGLVLAGNDQRVEEVERRRLDPHHGFVRPRHRIRPGPPFPGAPSPPGGGHTRPPLHSPRPPPPTRRHPARPPGRSVGARRRTTIPTRTTPAGGGRPGGRDGTGWGPPRRGGRDDRKMGPTADPVAGPDEAVVRVEAAALNFFDTLI